MNLLEEAESLMLHQFANSAKLKALVRCLVKPVQEVLDIIDSLRDGEYLKEAQSDRLDILGEIVGQVRRGMNDDDYRAWVQVGIKLNNCAGTAEDMFTILRLLCGSGPPIRFQEFKSNDVVFTILAKPKATVPVMIEIMKSAIPVTIPCHFVRAYTSSRFTFDRVPFPESHLAEFF